MQKFTKKVLALVLCYLVVALTLTGCTTDQVIASINVADQIVISARTTFSTIDPEYNKYFDLVDSSLKEVSTLYASYEKATATTKPGIAGQIQAVIGTITSNLASVLATVKIKNPTLVTVVTAVVATANTAITLILANVPSATPPTSAQAQLPTVPNAKSSKDLKDYYNAAIRSDSRFKPVK
jgi:hypothetical protein